MKIKLNLIVPFIVALFFVACSKNNTVTLPGAPPPAVQTLPAAPVAATITGFSPATAWLGDTVTISGQHLATDLAHLTIKFGTVPAGVISVADNVALVTVPQGTGHAAKIKFTTLSIQAESAANFVLKAPVIQSLSVTSGFEGQPITAYGKGFSDAPYGQRVSFGSDTLADQQVSAHPHTQFNVEIPYHAKAGKYPVSIVVDGVTATAPKPFEVLVPVITATTTHAGSEGIIMTITGTNLKDVNGAATQVYFNYNGNKMGFPVAPLSVTANKLELKMPANRPGNYNVNVWILKSTSNFIPFTVTQ